MALSRNRAANRNRRLLAALFALFACLAAEAGERPVLRLFTWSDFFAPDLIGAFEDRHQCIVAVDNFDSNEQMLEDLAGLDGEFTYDIITPSSYMSAIMRQRGLLRDLDHRLVPNLPGIDRDFARLNGDPDFVYSVPYTRTVTGVGYNRDLVDDAEPSWDIFANPALAGKVTMLDDMRESLGAALKYLGYSLNTVDPAEIARAADLLLHWRDNLATFEVDEGNLGLAAGDYAAVHSYNGDVAVLMEENPEIDFFVPAEGSAVTSDDFVIPVDAANPSLAHAFINHFLEPGNAAVNMAEIMYYMPVPEALRLLDERVSSNHAFAVPAEVLAKCEVIQDVGEGTVLYEEAWERVKKGD